MKHLFYQELQNNFPMVNLAKRSQTVEYVSQSYIEKPLPWSPKYKLFLDYLLPLFILHTEHKHNFLPFFKCSHKPFLQFAIAPTKEL